MASEGFFNPTGTHPRMGGSQAGIPATFNLAGAACATRPWPAIRAKQRIVTNLTTFS